MSTIIPQLLYDKASLLDYEQQEDNCIDFALIRDRLIAIERLHALRKSDSFYHGMGEYMLQSYESLPDMMWQLPYNLSKKCLYEVQGKIYIKAEFFNDWMELLCQFPPLYIIAGFFIEQFSTSFLLKNKSHFIDFQDNHLRQFYYTAQLLPYIKELNALVRKEGGLHDLHIHLNGSTESDIIWHSILNNPHQIIKKFSKAYHQKNGRVRRLTEQISPDLTPEVLLNRIQKAKVLRGELLQKIFLIHGLLANSNEKDKVYDEFLVHSLWKSYVHDTRENDELIDELLFYLLVMDELRTNVDEEFASKFHHYMLIKGLVHQFVVMQHSQVGFSQFQLLTENSLRDYAEKDYTKRFLQLGGGTFEYLSTIEGRFSPKDSKQAIFTQIGKIKKGFKKAQNENALLDNCKLSLIAHFIKKPETRTALPIQHRFLRKELKRKALALKGLLSTNKSCKEIIVGVDAAASEFDTRPEVFAPAFRFLRKTGIPHFTFHVGEDFNHLLSGLRVIEEAVEFLELQYGDRLGHCTALGIDPELWLTRIGESCYMSPLEWLDDLIFVWYLIKEERTSHLQTLKLILESEISEWSEKVYEEVYSPINLVKLWKLRKYDPFDYYDSTTSSKRNSRIDSYEEEMEVRKNLKTEKLQSLYRKYHASSIERTKINKTIEIHTQKILNADDLREIQRILLTKLSQKGIIIEALPTSNLRISYYKQLEEYHLAKWLADNNEQYLMPFVVIGTDDPGIFSTNIYNEYARAYLHMQTCDYSSSVRFRKICEMHEWSNIYKFTEK